MVIKKKLLEDVFNFFFFLFKNIFFLFKYFFYYIILIPFYFTYFLKYNMLIMTKYTNYFKYFLKSCQNKFSKTNSVLNKNIIITIKTFISLITATALDFRTITNFQKKLDIYIINIFMQKIK